MPVNDALGTRMKTYYEDPAKTSLIRRMPVAIRVDGKAFHTFTRGFQKPYDRLLMTTMQETMLYLCENIQGCILGYTQSDEITLILVDYQKLETSAWFDNEVEKICSVSASMATLAFNKFFDANVCNLDPDVSSEKSNAYYMASQRGALFDSRCFNIPKEEVTNLIYWRQLDAMRNSVQMAGRAVFSHRELEHRNTDEIKAMLLARGIDWEAYATDEKRGSCCVKGLQGWAIDREIPIFRGAAREYIDKLVFVGE